MTELVLPTETYWYQSAWFIDQLREREKTDRNTLGLVLGKPGRGKTTWSLDVCQKMDEGFSPDRIVFTYRQFRKAVEDSPENSWFVWDEPNRGLSHRNWYSQINKAVTTYLQTSRFRHKSILFALPKADLIDKAARAVMSFEAILFTRGIASVYAIEPNHFGTSPESFKYFMGEVQTSKVTGELWKAYQDKREEFHRKEFPDDPEDEEPSGPELPRRAKFEDVLKQVRADPSRFKDPAKGRLSPRIVSALCACSDQLARKAITRYVIEEASKNNAG